MNATTPTTVRTLVLRDLGTVDLARSPGRAACMTPDLARLDGGEWKRRADLHPAMQDALEQAELDAFLGCSGPYDSPASVREHTRRLLTVGVREPWAPEPRGEEPTPAEEEEMYRRSAERRRGWGAS